VAKTRARFIRRTKVAKLREAMKALPPGTLNRPKHEVIRLLPKEFIPLTDSVYYSERRKILGGGNSETAKKLKIVSTAARKVGGFEELRKLMDLIKTVKEIT
jgi:hypothetical protein